MRRLRRMRGTGPRATETRPRVFFSVPCEGQALALRGAGVRGLLRSAGPVPRNRALILAILFILAILLQTRERLRT